MSARKFELDSIFPLMAVKNGAVLSKRGEVTVGYELELPSAYSVPEKGYDAMVYAFESAMRILPQWSVMHRQDIYTYDYWKDEGGDDVKGFLSDSYTAHYDGRRYLTHRQRIFLTFSSKQNILKRNSASGFFGFKVFNVTPPGNAVLSFAAKAQEFISVATASTGAKFRRLEDEDYLGKDGVGGLIQECLYLGDRGNILQDIMMSPSEVRVGDKVMNAYTISEAETITNSYVSSTRKVEELSGVSNEVYLSYSSAIGMNLDCEHIINQYIVNAAQDVVLADLDLRRRKMNSMSSNSENRVNRDEIDRFVDAVHSDSLVAVYSHVNVLLWDREKVLEEKRSALSASLSKMGVVAVRDMFDTPVLWYSGLPGAACELGKDNLMLMELRSSLCMGTYETFDKGLEHGVLRLCDRIRHVPLRLDIQRAARERGLITNYNGVVIGPSGSGKSFFMNHLLENCYAAGEHVFVIDVGDSYEGLCGIIRAQSGGRDGVYQSWDMEHPFSFCPFLGYRNWFDDNGNLRQDEAGATFIMSFLQTLWEPTGGWTSDNTPILRQMLTDFIEYYCSTHTDELPVFDDFYKYLGKVVQPRIVPVYDDKGEIVRMPEDPYVVAYNPVRLEDFDFPKFMRALEPYSVNGAYSFLLNDRHPRDLFESRFTVFEVDKLSKVEDKKFYSLCVLCIMNAFDLKMRQTKGFKVMVIEEAWSAIANETMAPYMRGLWKTSRKFSCSAIVVSQEIDDIITSPVIRETIIQNSDVKILLDQQSNKNKFTQLTEVMGLDEMDKNLILSVNKNKDTSLGYYQEVAIKLGSNRVVVYSTEVSKNEAVAFESDKEKKRGFLELSESLGNSVAAIVHMTGLDPYKKVA